MNVKLILKSSCLIGLGFLVLHEQLIKKTLFYTCQFSFLSRLGESLIKPMGLWHD